MLDDFLPGYDVNEVHSTRVSAAPETVMAAALDVTPREVPLLVGLMALRSAPTLLTGRRPFVHGSILDGFRRGGFVVLAKTPDELVVGAVGRFWRPTGGVRQIEPGAFRDFREPGWAKGAFSFRVEPTHGRTLLTTETRVLATDDRARRSFKRYWLLIRPGSGAIRLAWLRAIRRRAERA